MVEPRQIQDMVGAMMRAVRSMGYYDATHPVFVRALDETMKVLDALLGQQGDVTLGCGGSSLIYDADAPPLKEEHCAELARRMFERSLIAVRIRRGASADHVASVLALLAETEARLRADGGIRTRLAAQAVTSIDAVEVDYAAIFSGEQSDLSEIVGDDPVVELAIRSVLAFQADGEGHALEVKIDELTTPGTLGDFLDDLLESTPSILGADGADGASDNGDMDADTFNRLASKAYLSNQKHMRGGDATKADLAASAQALSDRMVRLSPKARLQLLIELGGKEADADADAAGAIGALGDAMGGSVIAEALASGLTTGGSGRGVIDPIANLVKRLRPLEKDRDTLLEAVDGAVRKSGARTGGLAWQEITRRAMDRAEVGQLQLHSGEVRQRFIDAHAARTAGGASIPGFELFSGNSEERVKRQTAAVVGEVLEGCATVASSVITSTRALIERLETDEDFESSTTLISALANRADIDRRSTRPTVGPGPNPEPRASTPLRSPSSVAPRRPSDPDRTVDERASSFGSIAPPAEDDSTTARTVLSSLLGGADGAARALRWARSRAVRGETATQLLLDSVEMATDPEQKRLLIDKLSEIDSPTLQNVAMADDASSAEKVLLLVGIVAKRDISAALRLARHGLRSPDQTVKVGALKALTGIDDPLAFDHLGIAAGAEGDERARALLGAERDKSGFITMQDTALKLLAASQSSYAARHLEALLTRRGGVLFRNKRTEALRLAAARALAANGTEEAMLTLEAGLEHKDKVVRATCAQVLGRRASQTPSDTEGSADA